MEKKITGQKIFLLRFNYCFTGSIVVSFYWLMFNVIFLDGITV